MARVTGPLHSVSASGSVSGIQFSKTRAGFHCGLKSTSTRAAKQRPLEYRSRLSVAQHAWSLLDPAIQAQYAALAPDTITPRQMFLQRALRCLAAGFTVPTDPPSPPQNRGGLFNLTYTHPTPPSQWGLLTFGAYTPLTDWILVFQAPYAHDAIPHPRKFAYQRRIYLDWLGDSIDTRTMGPRFAIKLALFRPSNGQTFYEWTAILNLTENHTFEDYTP